jgi:uncharacterized protein
MTTFFKPTPIIRRPASLSALLTLSAALLAACGGGGELPPLAPDLSAQEQSEKSAETLVAQSLPSCPAPAATLSNIAQIQGEGDVSPLVGQAVSTRGVVVGDFQADNQQRGFYIQQPVRDDNSRTSEGLFVFAPGAVDVKVGDYVQISGVVAEFPDTAAVADRMTQIANPTEISVCGTAALPQVRTVRLPVSVGQTLERWEGMRVRFSPQQLRVTELFDLGRFGEMVLTAGERQFNITNGNEPRTADQLRRARIVLDDGSTRQNPSPTPYFSATGPEGVRRLGDTVDKLEGVVAQAFGAYRVHPTTPPTFVNTNPRPLAPNPVGGTLKVASMNVLNYFTTLGSRGADTAAELTRQRDKIVSAIVGLDADVLGVIEVQNDSGGALATLVDAVNARLGSTVYVAVNSARTGTDEIRVAMIYKPANVRPIGSPRAGTDPRFAVDRGLRPPLAQRFAANANDGGFWFIVSHLKSKGGCPSSGDVDLGQGCWNLARNVQAQALTDWAAQLVAASGEPDVLMAGDFNAYLQEDPINTIRAAGFSDLAERLPPQERYSFVFEGFAGLLDHEFASASLNAQVTGMTIWHINADEPNVIDYNTENKPDDRYAPTPFRSADHDPVLVGLNLTADVAPCAPTVAVTVPTDGAVNTPVQVTGLAAGTCTGSTLAALTIDWGDGTPAQALDAAATTAEHVYTAAGRYTVTVTAINSSGVDAQSSGTITIAGAPTGGAAELFFSEYVEGSSNNKALEVFNPGTAAVDLSAYTVRLYNNGAATPNTSLVLSGTLAPGATLVIVNANASAPLLARANLTSGVTNFNGDDAVVLEKSGAVVDAIGQVGFDPGTQWSANGVNTLDRTIRRKGAIVRGDTVASDAFDPSLEWDVFATDDFTGLGLR